MKKIMMVLLAMVLAAAPANAAVEILKEEEEPYYYYVLEQDGVMLNLVDDSYQEELINNTCHQIVVDGEIVDMVENATVIMIYTVKTPCNGLHVLYQLDDKIIDVDIDTARGKEVM